MNQTSLITRCVVHFAFLGLTLIAVWQNHAAGTVTVCDETDLDAALNGGGTVTFACDGTIILASTKTISADTILDAAGHTITLSGNNAVRLFAINPAVSFSIYNLTLANGRSTNGGAVYNSGTLIISNSVFSNNSASNSLDGQGGAIYSSVGNVEAINSTFANNASRGGDGANNTAINGTGFPGLTGAGGAIYINAGNLSVTNCTFNGNSTAGGRGGKGGDEFLILPAGNGGPGGPASGGGIGVSTLAGTLTVVNSTFVGNSCAGGNGGNPGNGNGGGAGNGGAGSGGGIRHDGLTANLINATFSGNGCVGGTGSTHGNALGGNLRNGTGLLTLKNTIVANSSSGTNCFGTITDGGNNISTDSSCNFIHPTSLNNTNARLSTLADNGGPTFTVALLQNSPAIDAGNCADNLPDQRGFPRFGACDIGAFEMTPPAILSIVGLGNGHQRLQCSGVIGPSYAVQASTNLMNWVTWMDLASVTNRIFEVTDTDAPVFPRRFYRLQAH